MTRSEYRSHRQEIISRNRSRRLLGMEPLPVSPRLPDIMGFEVYDSEGTYEGFTLDAEEAKQYPKAIRKPYIYDGNMPVGA